MRVARAHRLHKGLIRRPLCQVRGGEMDGLQNSSRRLTRKKLPASQNPISKRYLRGKLPSGSRLTLPFRNGRDAAQRILGRVYDQSDYALRYRQARLPDRVIAGINMMSEPLLARQEIQVEVRDEIRRIADG